MHPSAPQQPSPLQHLPDVARQALADNQLLAIAQGEEPALAAQGRQLAHVIHVDQGVAMDALERGAAQARFDAAQPLGRHITLAQPVTIQTISRSA